MKIEQGTVAVITGSASGIGAGLARAIAARGGKVVLADVADTSAVEAELRATGADVLAQRCDVTDPAAMAALADATYERFGQVNLLCNNAGVVLFSPLLDIAPEQWDWIINVNVRGVINGVSAFVPRMIASGAPAHVLNTASGAGLVASGAMPLGAYTTTKFAVVGYSEALRLELAPHGIGLTILCPGSVQTGILETARYSASAEHLRPAQAGGPTPSREGIRRMQPADVAALVLDGVERSDLYVITHPESWEAVASRFQQIQHAYGRA